MGSISDEDRRQVSLLMAQAFEHITTLETRLTPTIPRKPWRR